MTSENYHKDVKRISKSGLDLIDKTPLDYWFKYLNPDRPVFKETPALIIGKAFHSATTEPEKYYSEFAVMGEFDRRTTAGKQGYADFVAANQGKTYLTIEQHETASKMAEAVRRHPLVSVLLEEGEAEKTFEWENQETGAKCKCRPDWITKQYGGYILDFKSTEDARPDQFARSCINYRYDVQAPFYEEGVNAATGMDIKKFLFIAVEKTAPYKIGIYDVPQDIKLLGQSKYLRNLDTYVDCVLSNEWPGLSEEPQQLTFPQWAMK